MDPDLLQSIIEYREGRHGAAALATVIKASGSTPRNPGTKMIIRPDGRIHGTVGGGCGEAEVIREALQALRDGRPRVYTINLTNEAAVDEGMVCGGRMEVFIELLSPVSANFGNVSGEASAS